MAKHYFSCVLSFADLEPEEPESQSLKKIFFTVQGCANVEPKSRHMWVKRTGDDLHVKCNNSGESWYLTCTGEKWRGQLGNCSEGGYGTAAKRGKWRDAKYVVVRAFSTRV